MNMPEMDGRETFLSMKEINPNVKTMLISGYSENMSVIKTLNEGAMAFIQKPFNISQFYEVINDLLLKDAVSLKNN